LNHHLFAKDAVRASSLGFEATRRTVAAANVLLVLMRLVNEAGCLADTQPICRALKMRSLNR
jgi:hypothetical protein